MMRTRSGRPCWQSSLACLVVVLVLHSVPIHATEHQLFLFVMNSYGLPVNDLLPHEVVIEHQGEACAIRSLKVDTDPMKVALLVDNSDGALQSVVSLRRALSGFLDTLPARHEIGLFTISGQTRRLHDFTTDRAALAEEVDNLFVERDTATLLSDGLVEVWRRYYADEDSWPVFVAVLYGGAEGSRSVQEREFRDFTRELQSRGASYHAVLVGATGANRQTDVSMFLTDATGGRYEAIAAATAVPNILGQLATSMGAQFEAVKDRYRVTFECDDDSPQRVLASVSRPAVAVRVYSDRRVGR